MGLPEIIARSARLDTIFCLLAATHSPEMIIAPIGDGQGKIFVAAENRRLKIKPTNLGKFEPVIETIYQSNPEFDLSDEIIRISTSIPSSVVFTTINNHGVLRSCSEEHFYGV